VQTSEVRSLDRLRPENFERFSPQRQPSTMSMIKLSPRVLNRRISTRSISTSSILQQDSWEDAPSTQSRTYGVPTRPKPVKKSKKVYNHPPAPPTTPAELERIAERRILRAERLERKDLTAQLTPTKTCTLPLPLPPYNE
jgi:hypothetical protein